MPRAKTDLTDLLVGDKALCVRRPVSTTASRQGQDTMTSHAGSPAASAGLEAPGSTPPGCGTGDDLARVVEAWAGLPASVRAAILAMIRETAGGGEGNAAGSGCAGF